MPRPRQRAPEPISHDEARRLYLETATPLRVIAERLLVSETTLGKLRARLGWPARPARERPKPRARRMGRPPTVQSLVNRLGRQVGRRLAELEAAEAAAPAGEYASLLRAMTELARLDAAKGSGAGAGQGGAPGPGEAGGGEGGDGGSDPDALREAIARRVEAFGGSGHAPALPGDAAAG